MNICPAIKPRISPNVRITLPNMINTILIKVVLDLEDRGLEDRFGPRIISLPKRVVMKIFGLKNSREEGILEISGHPSRMKD
jgi:hypothetical protein